MHTGTENTPHTTSQEEKTALLSKLYTTFQHGLRSGKANEPRKYLAQLGLDYITLNLGFNSGQFHHRKSEAYKQTYEKIGVLKENPSVNVNKEGRIAYSCFGNYAIIYPLKDEKGSIVNLFADRFKLQQPKTSYLYPETGLYPSYPHPETQSLYFCETIQETASLLQFGILENKQATISLEEGKLTEEHMYAIANLAKLTEVILITSNSQPSYSEVLSNRYPHLRVRTISLDSKTLNQRLQTNTKEEIATLMHQNKLEETFTNQLVVDNPQKLTYQTSHVRYEVLGSLPMDLGQLRISLRMVHLETGKIVRLKLDLFDYSYLQTKLNQLPSAFNINQVEADIIRLTELLETHREQKLEEEKIAITLKAVPEKITPAAKRQAVEFLSEPNLMSRIDKLIETTGIVGEKDSRKTAFVIAASYKNAYPLHGLVQASSGKGKSYLINKIASLLPQEDVINFSRITARSLYNYQSSELMNKLIVIQDESGLDEESLYAFRELQSAGYLLSSTSVKNRTGQHHSRVTKVEAHFSSLMATTKTAIYPDNESRSILMGIDESDEQTHRIITYTNKQRAGIINQREQEQATYLLRNCVRMLLPKEVINPFAHLLKLPVEAKMLRRLNQQFQDFVTQITLLHQYQRKNNAEGKLIATKQDLTIAVDLFFSSIMFKVDELDSSTRQHYEKLKGYILTTPKGTSHEFTRKEVREVLNQKKTKTREFVQHLQELEYIQITSGSANRGYCYQITQWDKELEQTRQKIKNELQEQIENIQKRA